MIPRPKDDDYTVQNTARELRFASNTTGPQYINIDVTGDALYETDEQFTITLSRPAGVTHYDLPASPTITGIITNDDAIPTVTIADSSGMEGNNTIDGSIEFTVTLSAAAGVPVKVNYATSNGSAIATNTDDSDYDAVPSGTVIIAKSTNNPPVSNLSESFSITTKADGDNEIDETFEVTLSLPPDANADCRSQNHCDWYDFK